MLVDQIRPPPYIQQNNTDELERMDFTLKAPDSFLLYCTLRRQELNGEYISTHQLKEDWKLMSKEQKAEFQNQSQCIQFTLDIDNRNLHYNKKRLIPKIVVPPPSSMVIPNDHSAESSPISQKEDETDGYFNRKDPQHHRLSDLLLDSSFHFNGHTASPPHPPNNNYIYHEHNMYAYHHHPPQMIRHSRPIPTPPLYSFHHHKCQQQSSVDNYKVIPNLSYSTTAEAAAAEAAALESLSFENNNTESTTITKTVKRPPPTPISNNNVTSQSTKRKYGVLPEKVKRPPNAYLLFNRDMRRQLHDVNQGLSSGEISKSISLRWKQLSLEEKEYYFKEESKLKQQHNNEHANFIYTRRSKAEMKQANTLKQQQKQKQQSSSDTPNSISFAINVHQPPAPPPPPPPPKKTTQKSSSAIVGRDPRGRKKKKADDSLPKHPMSGFLHFAQEMRPIMKRRFPDARLVEISKQIALQWRAMSTDELQPWRDIANLDKARYAREMKDRIQQQQQQQQDDAQSFVSSDSSDTFSSSGFSDSNKKRKFSSVSSTTTAISQPLEELDSDTIATVAQMVNPMNSND